MNKKYKLWKFLLASVFVTLVACPPSPKTENSGDIKKKPDPVVTSKVATITRADSETLTKEKFADKGYTAIVFEESNIVTTIEAEAFIGNKITELDLPDSVETVGENAFKGNPITKLTIGKAVTTIGDGAFDFDTKEKIDVKIKSVPSAFDTAVKIADIFGKKNLEMQPDTPLILAIAKTGGERSSAGQKLVKLGLELKKISSLLKVTFDSNGGSNVPPKHVVSGQTITAPTPPTKADSTLEGWYSDTRLTAKFDFNDAISAEETTLYAKWQDLVDGNTLAFSDAGNNSVGTFVQSTSDAKWVTDHPVESGPAYGVVVSASNNKWFTFTPKVTTDVADDVRPITYSVLRSGGDDNSGNAVFDLANGKITLKDQAKGGEYTILATKAETSKYKKSIDAYMLWILVDNPLVFPSDGAIDTKTGSGTFALASKAVTATNPANGDTFTLALSKTKAADKGDISYSSETDAIASVDSNGVVTIVDAAALVATPVTITITKAVWEYFKEVTLTYTLEGRTAPIKGDVLEFSDAGNNNVGNLDSGDSNAQWVTNHPVAGGGTAYGIVVSASTNNFTFTPKVTTDVADDVRPITYSATYRKGNDDNSDESVFSLDINSGKITLKDQVKGGQYTITATKAATSTYTESTAQYTLWILIYNGFLLPDSSSIGTKTKGGTYVFTSTASKNTVTATNPANDDTFTFTARLVGYEDRGVITYKSGTEDTATVDSAGVVTIVDAAALVATPVTITITKAASEYFKEASTTYTLEGRTAPIKGDVLEFSDADDNSLTGTLTGDTSAQWVINHPVTSGTAHGVVTPRSDSVDDSESTSFTLTPTLTSDVVGDNRPPVVYSAAKVLPLAGSVSDFFTLNQNTGKIALKPDKYGKFTITAKKEATSTYAESAAQYTLWITFVDKDQVKAIDAGELSKIGTGSYTFDGQGTVNAAGAVNKDTFTLAFKNKHSSDKRVISYSSGTPATATVNSAGVVTIVDATALSTPVVITVTKPAWEYMSAMSFTYTIQVAASGGNR